VIGKQVDAQPVAFEADNKLWPTGTSETHIRAHSHVDHFAHVEATAERVCESGRRFDAPGEFRLCADRPAERGRHPDSEAEL
jgi:hypothetical protein